MSAFLTIRDSIRDFVRKFSEIVIPIFRFVLFIIMFTSFNKMFGYSDLLDRSVVVFLISVICALVSDPLAVLIAGAFLLVNAISVSLEIGVLFLVLFVLMYTLYMRMFPKCALILAIAPVLCLVKLTYAIPLIVVVTVGVSGIIPAGFGIIIYYFAKYLEEAKAFLDAKTEEDDFQAYSYIVEHLIKDKNLMTCIIAFAMTIIITYIIYRLPVDYAWYMAVGIGGIINLVFSLIVGSTLGAEATFGSILGNTILGMLIAVMIQACKGILNYSKKEVVQFEDDDYYYYVKAIPKYNSPNKKVSKKPVQGRQVSSQTVPKKPAVSNNAAKGKTVPKRQTANGLSDNKTLK